MKSRRSLFRFVYTWVLGANHVMSNRRLSKPLCIVILVVIQTLLLGYSIDFDFANIINGGDTQQLLNPQLFIQRSLSVWLDSGTGVPWLIPGTRIFYAIPLYVLNLFSKNIGISTFILLVALYSLPSIAVFLLSTEITKNDGISFFIGVFYSLNLYTAIVFHTPVFFTLYLFGVTPLLLLIFMKMESSRKYRKKLLYLITYSLLYLPIIKTINMFIIYLLLIPLIGFVINFGIRIPIKRLLKYGALTSSIIFLLALPFILPIIPRFRNYTLVTPITDTYSKAAADIALKQDLKDSFRFIRTYAWKCSYDESYGGILSYGFLKHYAQSPLLSFISYYPILIVLLLLLFKYPKLCKPDRSKISGLSLIAILTLFFITPSLTSIGRLLTENEIYIFRSAWKYFSIPYLLCLSLIMAFLLKQSKSNSQTKKFPIFLLILFLVHSVYILPAVCIYGKTINQWEIVTIPREYYSLAEFLNQQKEEFRILPVPFPQNFAGYVPYKWGYVGPDILYTLTNKPLIGKMNNTIAPAEYLGITRKLERATPKEIIQESWTLNAKYILLRNDVDLENPYIKVYNSPEYYKDALEKSDAIKYRYPFGDLILYEFKNYLPRIFFISTDTSGNNLSESLFHSTHQAKYMQYLQFAENSAPISLKFSKNKPVETFSLSITFMLEQKNITEGNWEVRNHGLIHTDLLKLVISPEYNILYIFVYLKNGRLHSLNLPFFRTEQVSTIRVDFQNDKLLVYLDEIKISETNLISDEITNKFHNIKIGSNMGNTEKFMGKIYNLEFFVDKENIVDTKKLFLNYPNYIEDETLYKLHLVPKKIKWEKISPTKYVITLNNSLTKNGGFLVFLNTYDPLWKAYYKRDGPDKTIPETYHKKAFEYANAWYLDGTESSIIVLEYTPQRLFNLGLKISLSTMGIFLALIAIPGNKLRQLKKQVEREKQEKDSEE